MTVIFSGLKIANFPGTLDHIPNPIPIPIPILESKLHIFGDQVSKWKDHTECELIDLNFQIKDTC